MRFLCLLAIAVCGTAQAVDAVDFNRDVRPVLAKNCFACHGPDENQREAGLRLDIRDQATAELDSGTRAIVPGKLEASELYQRIAAEDESIRMPPVDSGHELTPAQIDVLKRWIEQGAEYALHWSFVKPQRWSPPEVSDPVWPLNGIDNFIHARLEREGLRPSPAADRYALIRRVSLDLRGLPPTPEEVDEFIHDDSPNAYEKLVDRFLNDPAFGERWARMWLDLARYADSRGYGSDPLRPNIWRYRDWVIDAFNRNVPFDRFTVEQLAGDLLPDATLEQRIATAFHRNTMTNTEGGTDDEEFRVAAVTDRVDTTMQVWMGLTMGCAKCHNHKYDPITNREYYEFFAFFNQTADNDQPNETPVIDAPRRQDIAEIERSEQRIAALKRQLETPTSELAAEQAAWEASLADKAADAMQGRYVRIELPGQGRMLSLAEVQVFTGTENIAVQGKASQSSTDYNGPPELAIDGNTNGHYFEAKSTTHTKQENNPWWEVDLGRLHPIEKVTVWSRTDGNLQSRMANFRVLVFDESREAVWRKDVKQHPNPSSEFGLSGPRSALSKELLTIVDTPSGQRTQARAEQLSAYFRSIAPSLKPTRDEIARLEKSKPKFPTVPVMQELAADNRRQTYVMVKGNFLNKGEEVTEALPGAFHAPGKALPQNRLGVAQWVIDRENPLTARVAVNRFWSQLFGAGLVVTEEDFGTQGEVPSHPELLDWLATEFMRTGWDMKALLRLMVTSATYRQSSRVTEEHLQKDPRNRLMSRGARFRLPAETVRDQALLLSGLLSRKLNGPSVYPPQPEGLWRAAFNGADRKWPTSAGQDRYRRGLYTFWRRTVPYPAMATFDAPSREICTVRRIRTNTPLQAFVTLNDPAFVEAAQALARRIVNEGGKTVEEQAGFALRLCLVRPPREEQVQQVLSLFQSELNHYRADTEAAKQLATEPLGPPPDGGDVAELAAWTVIANVLLNLDAVLMKG